jgi:hypothetical protein
MSVGVILGTELVLIFGLVKLFFDVAAIRRMLENTGLFSGIPCDHCWMPHPGRRDRLWPLRPRRPERGTALVDSSR